MDEKSPAERASPLFMHPLNVVLIGEMAEAAGKRRSSHIDVLMGPLLSITPRGAGTVRGRVSGLHQPGRPLVLCVKIRRGVSTVRLGQSIGADLSLPSAIYGNGPTVSQTLLLWDSRALCYITSLGVFQRCKQEKNELLLLNTTESTRLKCQID